VGKWQRDILVELAWGYAMQWCQQHDQRLAGLDHSVGLTDECTRLAPFGPMSSTFIHSSYYSTPHAASCLMDMPGGYSGGTRWSIAQMHGSLMPRGSAGQACSLTPGVSTPAKPIDFCL
jgi:hypothetical protein